MSNNDVSEPKQVKTRRTKYKIALEREREELRQLLATSGGRWFLWRLLVKCGLFDTISHLDPHKMAISSGKRDIGLWVIEQINDVDTSGYLKLVNEAKDREI